MTFINILTNALEIEVVSRGDSSCLQCFSPIAVDCCGGGVIAVFSSTSLEVIVILAAVVVVAILTLITLISYVRKLSATKKEMNSNDIRYQAVVQSLNDDIFEIDVRSSTFTLYSCEGNMVTHDSNRTTYDIEEVVNFAHHGDKKKLKKMLSDLLTGIIDGFTLDYRVAKPTGIVRWIQIRARTVSYTKDGKPVKVLGVSADIDKRKKIEEKLSNQQSLYKLTMESLNDAIFDYDLSNDDISFSAQWYRMLGYNSFSSRETFEKWLELIYPEDRLSFKKTFVDSVSNTKVFNVEYRMLKADGEYRWILTRGKVVEYDSDNTPSRVLGTCRDIHLQKMAQEALKRRESVLEESKAELEKLTARLINANEAQRRYLAREMHDEFTQRLAVIAIETGKLEKKLAEKTEDVTILDRMSLIKSEILDLSEDIRRLSRHVHPSLLDDLGLVTAIRSEASLVREKRDIEINVIDQGDFEGLDKDIALAVYRVVQEALRNVVRHSGADYVDILMDVTDGRLNVSVEDNGKGFNVEEAKRKESLGIISMKERVKLVGGEMSITSESGRGTVVNLEVPIDVQR